MNTPFDRDMRRVCEPFERDHDRLRAELMASLPAEVPETPRLDATARRPLRTGSSSMIRRIVRIGVPVAAAAAVIVAVGLWPETSHNSGRGGSGRVYALSDLPNLLKNASVIHVKGWHYMPAIPKPGQTQAKLPVEIWIDAANGRHRSTYGGVDAVSGKSMLGENVSDGRYDMDLDHTEKTVTFSKLSPFMQRFTTRVGVVNLSRDIFCDPAQLSGFAKTGQEVVDGTPCEIWEGEFDRRGDALKYKYWFSPVSGAVARVQIFVLDQQGKAWDCQVFEKLEREVMPPPGLFDTEPPADYRLTNTKATAPADSDFDGITYNGVRVLGVGTGLVLEDGSVIVGWTSQDPLAPASQAALFQSLQPGGALPKLPVEVYALNASGPGGFVAFTGRHLAYTQKGGEFYEWGVFVPSSPVGTVFYYSAPIRDNRPDHGGLVPSKQADVPAIPVSAGEFNDFVVGAMAETSGDGTAPEHVTYESVMQLIQQIRSSLGGS